MYDWGYRGEGPRSVRHRCCAEEVGGEGGADAPQGGPGRPGQAGRWQDAHWEMGGEGESGQAPAASWASTSGYPESRPSHAQSQPSHAFQSRPSHGPSISWVLAPGALGPGHG